MKRRTSIGMSALGLLVGLCSLAGCGGGDDAAIAQGVATDVSGVTQNWDKVLSAAQRFTVLSSFNGEAERDNETGLVGERSPDTSGVQWFIAKGTCISKSIGGRKGWRLPAIEELASLIDPSATSPGIQLPPGHPFLNVQSGAYWSATSSATSPEVWQLISGSGNSFVTARDSNGFIWCVRGGMQESVY